MAFTTLAPGALLAPVPAVMVSCACEGARPNIITVAWTGTVNSGPPMLSVSVRKERYSHGLIAQSGEFVVNLVGRDQLRAMDLCGVKSGRDCDKFALAALTSAAVEGLSHAPAIAECPVYLACKVRQTLALGTHDMFLGEVVSVGVQDELVLPGGRVDFRRADLVAYCHGAYYALADALGFYGYSVASPEAYARRMKEIT